MNCTHVSALMGGCAATVEWAPESAAQYDVSALERPPQSESSLVAAQREEERRHSSFTLQQCLEVRPLAPCSAAVPFCGFMGHMHGTVAWENCTADDHWRQKGPPPFRTSTFEQCLQRGYPDLLSVLPLPVARLSGEH